jgi:hypothetical protein
VKRIVRVSVETMKIVENLPSLNSTSECRTRKFLTPRSLAPRSQ